MFSGWSVLICVVTNILLSQKKLEKEEEEAEEALFLLQTQISTAVGRLARIRRQRKVMKEKGASLFERGVQSLGELEREDGRVVGDLNDLGASPDIDWSLFGLDPGDLVSAGLVPLDASQGVQ